MISHLQWSFPQLKFLQKVIISFAKPIKMFLVKLVLLSLFLLSTTSFSNNKGAFSSTLVKSFVKENLKTRNIRSFHFPLSAEPPRKITRDSEQEFFSSEVLWRTFCHILYVFTSTNNSCFRWTDDLLLRR